MVFTIINILTVGFFVFQDQSDIKLGDTYETVLSYLRNDILARYKDIHQLDNEIISAVKPNSGLHESTIYEYHFRDSVLVKYVIVSASNPEGGVSFIYKHMLKKFGRPVIKDYNGYSAYTWPKRDAENGFDTFLFIGFSDWFQKDAQYTVAEISNATK